MTYVDMKDMRNEPRVGPTLNALGATSRLLQPNVLPYPIAAQGTPILDRALAASDFSKQARQATLGGMMDLNSFVELENAYDNRKAKDMVMVNIGMNLPIWRAKVKAGVHEAEHMKMAAQHDKRKTIVALEGAAKMAIYGMEDGYSRLKLYDDTLIPKVKRTYETLENGYGTGNMEAGFLDVLTTVQTILEFEEQRAQAVRDIHLAAADLEFLIGGPWSASDTAPAPDATPEKN